MPTTTIEQIQEFAIQIMSDLGAGYSECIYQTALYNKIAREDSSAIKEKSIPVMYEKELLGTCRADIITDACIIETKATRTMPPNVAKQIRKYLVNMHLQDNIPRSGIVVNFNQDTELVEFIVLDPIPAQPPTVYKRRKFSPPEEDDEKSAD